MKYRLFGLVGSVLLASCAGGPAPRTRAGSPWDADREYLAIFCRPSDRLIGIGFSPLGLYSKDPAYARAAEMAVRLLNWSIHVRVKGTRLFERTPGETVEYRGEKIDLLELPGLEPASCRLESLEVGSRGWIVAVRKEEVPGAYGDTASFAARPPDWISTPPKDTGWLYATGIAELSYKDEPGSWELATYHALVELAFLGGTRTGSLERLQDDPSGAELQEVDTVLEGFRIAARWRDRSHVYVLGKVPSAGLVSRLVPGG